MHLHGVFIKALYYFAFKDIDVIHSNPVRLCIRSGSDSSDRNPLLKALSPEFDS
jgi:hypothetical protein